MATTLIKSCGMQSPATASGHQGLQDVFFIMLYGSVAMEVTDVMRHGGKKNEISLEVQH